MDLSYVLFTVIIFSIVQNKLVQASACQQLLRPNGGNVTFEYSTSIPDRYDPLIFSYERIDIIRHIDFISGAVGSVYIRPDYRNRFSIYGYLKSPESDVSRWLGQGRPPWNISITLTNIARGDEGMYQLKSRIEGLDHSSFCLFILDAPKLMSMESLYGESKAIAGLTQQGRDFLFRGDPAEVFPSNSSYDVTMYWMLNGNILHTGASFIVSQDQLIILNVSPSLHGATLAYRASVDGTDVWTEAETRLTVAYLEVRLKPSQSVYAVSIGTYLPDIKCDVTSSNQADVVWTRGVKVITNGSILSLGQADVTMNGVYACMAKLSITGQIERKYIHVSVFEKSEQSWVATIILASISGLTVTTVVVMAILLWRNGCEPQRNVEPGNTPAGNTHADRTNTDNNEAGNTSTASELASYTALGYRPEAQQLYDLPGPSAKRMEPAAELSSYTNVQYRPADQQLYDLPYRKVSNVARP